MDQARDQVSYRRVVLSKVHMENPHPTTKKTKTVARQYPKPILRYDNAAELAARVCYIYYTEVTVFVTVDSVRTAPHSDSCRVGVGSSSRFNRDQSPLQGPKVHLRHRQEGGPCALRSQLE